MILCGSFPTFLLFKEHPLSISFIWFPVSWYCLPNGAKEPILNILNFFKSLSDVHFDLSSLYLLLFICIYDMRSTFWYLLIYNKFYFFLLFSLLKILIHYFLCMNVLPSRVSTEHMHMMHIEARRVLDPQVQELQYLGTGDGTWVHWKNSKCS